MNPNPKKCQILSENQNDLIIDEEENITLYSKIQTKYLDKSSTQEENQWKSSKLEN